MTRRMSGIHPADIDQLDALSGDIAACRKCDALGIAVTHCPPMTRGTGSDFMVIGLEPGRTEQTSGHAFSGKAGTRLMEWLQKAAAGRDRDEILMRGYFTSVAKCRTPRGALKRCAIQCRPFLDQQLAIVAPRVVVPLGPEVIQHLYGVTRKAGDLVGKVLTQEELVGTQLFYTHDSAPIVTLPHPSPGSRWLNSSANRRLLNAALAELRSLLS